MTWSSDTVIAGLVIITSKQEDIYGKEGSGIVGKSEKKGK
jgi:hypothetical protein